MEINELKEVLIKYGYELVSVNESLNLYNSGTSWVGHSDDEVYVSPSVSIEEMETIKTMVGASKMSELGAAMGMRPNSVVFYPKKYAYSLTVLRAILDSVGAHVVKFDSKNGWLYCVYGNSEVIFKIDEMDNILHVASAKYDKNITEMLLKLGCTYSISIVDFGDADEGVVIH